jgi:hypothetical protein
MPSVQDRAAAALEADVQQQAVEAQRTRRTQQKNQEKEARQVAKNRRRHEQKALRFFRKCLGAEAVVVGWHKFEPRHFHSTHYWLYPDELVLEVPGLSFAVIYVNHKKYNRGRKCIEGFLPYCADCDTILAECDQTLKLVDSLVGLGAFLQHELEGTAHTCAESTDSKATVRAV